MDNLFRHIEYLLLRHDCVIVPGLGAFIASASQARFDFENGVVTPPSRSVMFNQAVCSDDGLLANSFARKYKVSFEDARQIISRQVSLLKASLLAGKEVAAGRLGFLRAGKEGNIGFNPYDGQNFLGNSGLQTIALRLRESMDNEQNDRRPQYYQFRINKAITKIAAAVMFIVALSAAIILNPIPTDMREQRASVVPVDAIIHSKEKIEKSSADTVRSLPENDVESAERPLPSHYLIVATFKTEREADNFIAANASEDQPLMAVKSTKVTRVALSASDSKDELQKRLNSKEVHGKFPHAWIWSRRHNEIQ